jgi:hypothetical protein
MAAHRQIEGGFEWQLDLPPAVVRAVLCAVCVDLSDRKSTRPSLWYLLWSTKVWTVAFTGEHFELWPLARNSGFHAVFGLPYGQLHPTKSGTRVTVQYACSPWKRSLARAVFGGGAAAFFLLIGLLMALSPSPPNVLGRYLWLSALLGSFISLMAFAVWVPEATKDEELRFLDEVFGAQLVQGQRDMAFARQ